MSMIGPGIPGLGDREIAEDLLTSEKYFSDLYNKATLEASNPQVRNVFKQIHGDVQEHAKKVFDYLSSKGWYRVTGVDPQMLNRLSNTASEASQAISGAPGGGRQSPTAQGNPGGYYSQVGQDSIYQAGGPAAGQTGGYRMNPYVQQGIYQDPYSQAQGAIYQDAMSAGSIGGGYGGQQGIYQSPYYTMGQIPSWTRTETFGPPGTRYGVGAGGYGFQPSPLQQQGIYQGGYGMGYGGYATGLPDWARTETFGPPGTRYGVGAGGYGYQPAHPSPMQQQGIYQGGYGMGYGGYATGLPDWARTETFGPPGTRYGVGAGGYGQGVGFRASPYAQGHMAYSGQGVY
ncbi:MAG: spore coat protein [Bacillota bacterium]